jgi:hypothetical protein
LFASKNDPKKLASSKKDGINFYLQTLSIMSRKVANTRKRELDFEAKAMRAFRRVAIKVKAENRRFGLKDAVWPADR